MAPWLERMFAALAGTPDAATEVRRHLGTALRQRARIDLELVGHHSARCPGHLVTTIEQLREADMIIAQPTSGGLPFPLTTGEHLRLGFINGLSTVSAEIHCLGRFRTRSGTGGPFYGYRLTMPGHLTVEPRKTFMPQEAGLALISEVELVPTDERSSIVRGIVHDMFPMGLKIRSRNAAGRLEIGQRVYVRGTFAPPVGELTEMAHVTGVSPGDADDQRVVSIEFDRRLESYESLVGEMVHGVHRRSTHRGRRRRATA